MYFNAAKSWMLGWYANRAKSINPLITSSGTYSLIGLASYASSALSQTAVLQVQRSGSEFQNRVNEFPNRVTVVESAAGYAQRNALTSLGASSAFVIANIVVWQGIAHNDGAIHDGRGPTRADVQGNRCSHAFPDPSADDPPTAAPIHAPTTKATAALTHASTHATTAVLFFGDLVCNGLNYCSLPQRRTGYVAVGNTLHPM